MFLAVGSSVTSRRSQRERLAFKLYDIGKTVLKDQVGAEDGKASLAIVCGTHARTEKHVAEVECAVRLAATSAPPSLAWRQHLAIHER